MAQRRVTLQEDLAVFARCVLQYNRDPNRLTLSLVVLAQRVLLERARVLRRPHLAQRLLDRIKQISESEDLCGRYAQMPPDGSLTERYPIYKQTGLV